MSAIPSTTINNIKWPLTVAPIPGVSPSEVVLSLTITAQDNAQISLTQSATLGGDPVDIDSTKYTYANGNILFTLPGAAPTGGAQTSSLPSEWATLLPFASPSSIPPDANPSDKARSSGELTPTTTPSPPKQTLPGTVPIATSQMVGNTTIPSPGKSASGNSLATGAVAGVAIGCLIGGALIAGLAVWFCLGRARRARRRPDSEATSMALMASHEKAPAVKTVSLGSSKPMSGNLNAVLPQPLEDKAVSDGFASIGLAIKNHVQSYYHASRVSPGLLDLDDLQKLGRNLPISIGTLSTLLANPETREVALRFSLAWLLVSRMGLSASSETTLLPLEISLCSQAMVSAERTSRSHSMLLAKWRVISAELMQPNYSRTPFSASDSRLQSIERAIEDLDGVLRPYADSRMDGKQRLHNLREIIKRSANFAFTMFSQPSTWDFDWQKQHGLQSGSICIFPALVQTADEAGEPLNPPRAFTEAILRQLDG
ncbi:hypothetical protein M011DRAFT_478552 [Sporormia fimetaria CBS 119925]|uniref:Mid2 domain-containing protein n=1 Tax=Sporormia fimetaria CBS 119925 TaxID=1340428 RepID=A0A6A6V7W7_9PLEO|nr:hypothetical protein M011DRAFT_478552 [Sporormia fimetaria CBS 119925]